jgi:hypothetical protein
MKRKSLLSIIFALVMVFACSTSAFAQLYSFTIPSLNYTKQQSLVKGDMLTYVYKNNTQGTQSVNFRINNWDLNDTSSNLVVNKLTGEFFAYYPDGTRFDLGKLGGYTLSGELGNLPSGVLLVVNLKPLDTVSKVDFKIKFDGR